MSRRVLPFLFGALLAGCDHTSPLVPTNVGATSGDAQTDTVARVLPAPLVVTMLVEGGNPVVGAPVVWAVQSGGGSVPATAVTDAAGQASATWTLGPIAGVQTVRATAGGNPIPAWFRIVRSGVSFVASTSPGWHAAWRSRSSASRI